MRDFTPGRKIQQQIYTRERRGIFRSTEGYDTIAKSNGLESSFVKKVLHPFCVYDAPAELAASGEKDGALFPEAMHLLHLENGDVLLGRSVYQAADFTGLLSAFFTHNYIIPDGYGSKPASDYKNWLQAAFTDSYDIESGTELAELASLPTHAAAAVKPSYHSILSLLNIGEKAFKQLLYAVMAAVGGKKKVYIALDVPVKQLPDVAKLLLSVIYACLPYAFRKQLGFITYAKEPQSRKSVHLTFVEKGSLRQGDRNIEKDYTFDFANDRIINVDLEGTDQPFLEFAWDNLDRSERADSFFHFAEQMLAGTEPERQLAASSYHELCIIYQIDEGSDSLYETHKAAVLRGLLDYLQPSGSLNSKIRLNDLFLSRFDYEFDRLRQGAILEAFIVDVFKDYYQIAGKNAENKIVSLFILAINNAKRQNEQEAAVFVYTAVESNSALSKAFFARLISDSRHAFALFIPFLENKLKVATGAKSVLQMIEHWGNNHSRLFSYEPFHTLARQQLMERLERERYSIPAVSRALEQLHRLEGEARLGTGKKTSAYEEVDLYQGLELAAYRAMLTELDFDRLTKDQLASAQFLSYKDQLQRLNGQLQNPRQKSAAHELLAIYEWFALPEPTDALFGRLTLTETDRVQQTGRRLLAGDLEPVEYSRLVLAFLRSTDMETVDHAGLLDYLQRNASNKEIIYRFFRWSEKQPDFMRSRGFVPAYTTAIVGYFTKYDREAFRKRANRKQLYENAGSSLTAVYKQAEQELSSTRSKLFFRNRKATIITSIAVLGMIAAGIFFSFSGKGEEIQMGAALPQVQPTAVAGIASPDTLVYAEQIAGADDREAMTSLVFLFKDAAACSQFAPNSLMIEPPGVDAAEYTELELSPHCSSDTANDGTESGPAEGAAQSAAVSPAILPTATPVSNAVTATYASSGNDETGSLNAAATDSAEPIEAGAQPEQSSGAAKEKESYKSRVIVHLGKQTDIPADSIIRVGEAEYKLSVLHVVDK